jgi:hypothetical protein
MQEALLLNGGGLCVALRDDQPSQLRAILPRHRLPDRLPGVVPERNGAVRFRLR